MIKKQLPTLVTLSLLLITPVSFAQETRAIPDAPCKAAPPAKGKSRQRFDGPAFMLVASELEAQGEKNFFLQYEPPAAECLVERFEVSGQEVSAIYNPWERGTQTLLYRFVAKTPEGPREVLVLYSGMVEFVMKGQSFHVTETRGGVVSFYAMFKEQPTYQAAKEMAASIFSASAKPLLAVRWPEGAKEGEVVAFDSDKLK